MSRVRPAVLVACLLGVLASACSLSETTPKHFTLVDQRPEKAKEEGNTLVKAELKCKEETKRKGIASVANIFSRLRKGSADEDYAACMKRRVTATEMLKFVTCDRSSLQATNSSTSGWSTRRIPMFAPRRVPPCFTASVDAS